MPIVLFHDLVNPWWLPLSVATGTALMRLATVRRAGWCAVFKDEQGAVVDPAFDGKQVLGRVDAQVGALEKYRRSRPLPFSLLPRCNSACASQK